MADIRMDAINRLNRAMEYIEKNLESEIDYRTLAQQAGCSEYHFRRLFSFLCGMNLNEYIRRRRLAQAALDLCNTKAKVIDIAVKYGYESPDSFSRAFQEVHGLSPKEARKAGASLRAFPPLIFHMTIKGEHEMEYRIVEKDVFRIVGIKKRIMLQYHGVNPEIAAMWAELDDEKIRLLKGLSNLEPTGLLSASVNFTGGREEGTTLDQWIGVATSAACPPGWQTLEVTSSLWAVFTARGRFPDALQQVWARIYAEWLPMSGYEVNRGPELLWNEGKDTSKPDYHSEIWIPVIKSMS